MKIKQFLVVACLSLSVVGWAQEVPYLQWAYRVGGNTSLDDYGRRIKVDGTGNVYVVGAFAGSTDFDPGVSVFTLQSTKQGTAYTSDAFITKFNSSGGLVWAKAFGGISTDNANGFTFDNSGNILITGRFDETVDFDPGPGTFNLTATLGGMFVLKLKPNGDFVWATAVESANGLSITTDNSGNVYATGSYSGNADFDPGSSTFILTSNGASDIFIQKLDAAGNFVTAIAIGGSSSDIGSEIVFSQLNEIYLTGYFSTTVDFDPGSGTVNRTSAGSSDIFLSKWSTSLSLTWANRFGASSTDVANAATVDASGNLYFTGYFQNTVDFDPSATTFNLVSAGGYEIVIGKYSPAGDLSMAKRIGSTGSEYGDGIAVDASNNIYVTGSFQGTVDFDPDPAASAVFNQTSNGNYDVFTLKLKSDGIFLWATSAGAANSDNGHSIATDGLGNIYSTGRFRNTTDFDFGSAQLNLTSYSYLFGSQSDAFIQKIITTPSLFVYTQPSSVSICPNNDISFNALGTGAANITYQWQKFNGSLFVDLVDGSGISGAATAQLTITNATAINDGDYQCTISGNLVAPVSTNSATLTVITPPTAPTTTGATICGGGQVTLTAAGGTPGDYRWYSVPTGGSPLYDPNIGDEGGEYSDPTLVVNVTTTTTYYATIINGQCESTRTPVTATVTSYTATPAELAALATFYTATDGDHWNDNSNWDGSDVSMYYGVDISGCKISGIDLSNNGLVGTLPPEIGALLSLENLNVSGNNLSGSIPVELGNLVQLKNLELSSNSFTGTIPIELGNLTALNAVSIAYNQLTGNIPVEIGNLTQVGALELQTNLLTGSIPVEMGNLTQLYLLRLNDNELSGIIPTQLTNLINIQEMDLSYNRLTGAVPSGFATMPSIEITLRFSGNLLTSLPDFSVTPSRDLQVENNALTFGDLEPNMSVAFFSYSPQARIPPGGVVIVALGNTLTIPFSTSGTANSYQWFKEGTLIPGATSATFSKANATDADLGIYTVQITNSIVPGLTLESEDFIVQNSFCSSVTPTSGDLDLTFAPVFNGGDPYTAIEIQSTGKSIVATPAGIFRFNTNGTIDGTFTTLNDFPSHHQLAVQSDNKIVTIESAGTDIKLVRLTENGAPDVTFSELTVDNSGFYTSYFGALAAQPDGKVLYTITNTFDFVDVVMRLDNDGTPDATFNNPSGLTVSVISPQTSGDIYIGSYVSPFIYRLDSQGNIDSSFDPGSGFDNYVSDLVVQPDGKILVTGAFTTFNGVSRNGIARLNANGTLDTSFDPGTGTLGGMPESIAVFSNGKIIIAGSFLGYNGTYRKGIARLNSDGTLDCAFDPGNGVDGSISDLAIQADEKILIAGNFTNYNSIGRNWLARINNSTVVTINLNLQPSNVVVCVGNTATFSTAASGTTNITYQWQYSSDGIQPYTDIVNGANYSNVTTAALSVNTTGNFGSGKYRCRISGDNAVAVFSNPATLTVDFMPASPTTTGAFVCGSGSVNLNASGGTNGQYRWYTNVTGGTAIAGETNSNYVTPNISVNTDYYVSIANGACESARAIVTAIVNLIATPVTTGLSSCSSAALALTASGGTDGEYRWYTTSTGGTAIAGEVNSTFTTPVIAVTTSYYVSINNGTCESARVVVTGTINTPPSAPTTTPASICSTGAALTLSASSGTNGQYRWYTVATGGTAINSEVNSTYTTPVLNTTTDYYVSIDNGTCESSRSIVTATINSIPAAPTVTPASVCGPLASATLTASGATDGQYRWYTVATGGTAIAGEVNASYTTPALSNSTTYFVSINNGSCESLRTSVLAEIKTCTSKQPPVIQTVNVTTEIEGSVKVGLLSLLSDPDNDIDLTRLTIVVPPKSGAVAIIDDNQNLLIDYKGLAFSGIDEVTIEVCDFTGKCVQQKISIEVIGDVVVYNGISPDGNGQNDFFELRYIDVIEAAKENRVIIFNRWGSKVFEMNNYNNTTRIFSGLNQHGEELPAGTYFYKIEFASGKPMKTGYLTLKR